MADIQKRNVAESTSTDHHLEKGAELGSSSGMGGTDHDEHEMRMLGRTQQLNKLPFYFYSRFRLYIDEYMGNRVDVCIPDWYIDYNTSDKDRTSAFALINGGTAGLVWGYLIVWMGYMLVFATIAEMASMAPTSGGQYHWVSEFAPRKWQRFVSYTVGWTSVLGWQTGLASLTFLTGTMIQGLLVLNRPEYVPENWHGTLFVIAITAFCIIFNTFLAKKLPMVEGMVLIIHILGFFAVLIPLWVLAPRSSPADVFTTFSNFGGWKTTGLAFMVGLLSPIYTLIGADSAVHMSEEIKDASIVLPKAIMWAAVMNGSLGFVMVITFCFTLGNILDIIDSPTGYPFIQVFFNATQSYAGTSIMTSILIVNITSACISTVATVSRQTWSFARDKGLPFSSFIAYVKPGWNIPLNAVLVTFLITTLLSLINVGSHVAFNAIGSLAVSALLATYMISFVCLIIRRLTGDPLPPRRWSLGRYGIFVNIGAVLYLSVVWVFIFFPIEISVTPESMNWSSVMFGSTMIFAVGYYFVVGRKVYTAPVDKVKRNL